MTTPDREVCTRLAGLLLAMSLLTGPAFGSAQDTGRLAVEPVEPFLATPLAPSELRPDAAVFEVTTTIDLACAIVFGEVGGFGRLAVDQQMGSEAHRDHRVVLTGLEPDRVYQFRFQGSAPDGRLFASSTGTFRTPTLEADPRFGAPLELRASSASSEYSNAFGAANAVDGDGGSEWSSRGDGNDAWIELELPHTTTLSGIGVWTRTMSSSARITRFRVVTDDGVHGPFDLPDANGLHRFELRATTRTLRLEVLASTGGNTGLVELEAYRVP